MCHLRTRGPNRSSLQARPVTPAQSAYSVDLAFQESSGRWCERDERGIIRRLRRDPSPRRAPKPHTATTMRPGPTFVALRHQVPARVIRSGSSTLLTKHTQEGVPHERPERGSRTRPGEKHLDTSSLHSAVAVSRPARAPLRHGRRSTRSCNHSQ